ncbi:hypothetical protein GOP47_0008265 [Adiantum capillus-veneris]|uniref:Histone-lysine N-methyltransferase SUVR5 n=1 Tax=Adiantum capillus-veneris TaxID=13818 RepID=A0A9D4UXY2_ADICA|nr:hypothetical protein GOP47_0008265 [Adiantum capillus-veneris]
MEGQEGKVESGDQVAPAIVLPPKAQLRFFPPQETLGFHVDLARVAPNGEGEQLQASCPPDASAPNRTLDTHSPPSTPHLPHPLKHEGNQCSSSPTLLHGMVEGRVPLWIKWRGKWQAGLQCSLEDCPGQTIKAMPTYGRKSYIVVFFPNTKSFVWTDWQLVCPMFENPEPLAFGTHESGRDSVSDLNAARQFMLRKISSALLDISDRLPVQAVVNCARDVRFWKDFAKDAAKAVSYQELGGLLVMLKNMILPNFIKEFWLQNYVEDWKQQCERVETAASMEKLAKELKSAVVWDEVGKLWDQMEQTNMDSEWTTWKENANSIDLNAPTHSIMAQNRPCNLPHGISEGSHRQGSPAYAGIEDSEQQDSKRIKIEDKPNISELPADTLIQRGIGKNTYILSLSAVTNSTQSWGSRNEGAVVEPVDDQKKGKLPMLDNPGDDSSGLICIGTTKFGRRCTHKARDRSVFCLKHTSKLGNGENFASMPYAAASSGSMGLQPHEAEQAVLGNRKRKLGTASAGKPSSSSSKASKLASKVAAQFAGGTRCVGWCANGTQCSHRAKLGVKYCEKHLPTSMKGHQERIQASNATQSTQINENALRLSRLRELVNEYISFRLGEDGAHSSQHSNTWQKFIDAIRLEVDSKLNLTESLCSLISSEMESLKNHFEQEVSETQKASSSSIPRPIEPGSCSMPSAGEVAFEHLSNVELLKQVSMKCTMSIPRYRCKLCAQEFVELNVLGQHWRACHKKEAQQYFRGFACQHCNLPFTNKKALYRHRNNHHPGMSSQTKSLLALCNICSRQFMSFEDLWQHVICSHPDQMCAYWPVTTDFNSSLTPWKPSGLEVFDFGKCSDCDNKFSTYAELQQHRESAHKSYELSSHMESLRRISSPTDELKYKCKICGLRFRLLPDLGRHHQAEHKPAQLMRLKNGNDDALSSSPLEQINSIMGGEKSKKKLQKLDIRRAPAGSFKTETPVVAQQHAVSCDQTIADVEDYAGPKLEGFPSSSDILAVARSVCCKNKLYSVLLKKYVSLPHRLALKAAKLCSEANVRLEFYRDGYVCPYSCKEVALSSDSKPLTDSSFSFGNGLSSLPQFSQPFPKNSFLLTNKDILLDESHVVLTVSPGVKERIHDKMVLCEDLSFGKERVPIPCVVDRDVLGPCNCPACVENQNNQPEALMPWLNFSYVTKRTLDPSLGLDTESSGLGCGCQGLQCSPAQCEHVYIFDNDNTDAQDINGQPMVGRFPYDSQGCIILEEGYLVYECNSICSCHESCHNRVLQKGVQVKLEVYKTRHKGWAVRTAQRIARGTFVCEYIGEVLDDCEANKRGERYDKEGCSYLYDIDAHIDIGRRGRPKPFVIDATKYGNVARFINHSCCPNLVNYQVLVESMDCQLAHIGLYATRDINIGEELAYDYRYKLLPGKGCPCHCGAIECRGRLY